MLLEDKWAVVTGSNRGIGKAILTKFAENGANILAHARKKTVEFEEYCNSLEQKYSVKVVPIYFDATESAEMKAAVKEIKDTTGQIDILVNNLGTVNSIKLFQMTKMEEIHQEFDVNFFAQIEFTQYISRVMLRRKQGSIINISSCAAMDAYMGMLPYVSSKSALIGATRRLAIELGQTGIRVNSIAPGLTETDMAGQMQSELEKQTVERTIFKRMARPEEIANAVLFLASDLSSFVTGQVIRVDGGLF